MDIPHEILQKFIAIDYTREMEICAVTGENENEKIVGFGQYIINKDIHFADLAFAVRDDYHRKGIATELVQYLMILAKKQGLLGFTATVLESNGPALSLIDRINVEKTKHFQDFTYYYELKF